MFASRRRPRAVAGAQDVLRPRRRGGGRAGDRRTASPTCRTIDERCREIATEELGFDVPDVIYHLVRPEEVYFAAANGLPARYSSARWGAHFDAGLRPLPARPQAHLRADLQHAARARLPHGRQQPRRADARHRALPRPRLRLRAQPLAGRRGPRRSCRASCRRPSGSPTTWAPTGATGSRTCSTPATRSPSTSRRRSSSRRPPPPEPEHRRRALRHALPRRGRRRPRRGSSEERAALRRRFPRDPEHDLLGFIEATPAGSRTGSAT